MPLTVTCKRGRSKVDVGSPFYNVLMIAPDLPRMFVASGDFI